MLVVRKILSETEMSVRSVHIGGGHDRPTVHTVWSNQTEFKGITRNF